jgi:hypothetical protein
MCIPIFQDLIDLAIPIIHLIYHTITIIHLSNLMIFMDLTHSYKNHKSSSYWSHEKKSHHMHVGGSSTHRPLHVARRPTLMPALLGLRRRWAGLLRQPGPPTSVPPACSCLRAVILHAHGMLFQPEYERGRRRKLEHLQQFGKLTWHPSNFSKTRKIGLQ